MGGAAGAVVSARHCSGQGLRAGPPRVHSGPWPRLAPGPWRIVFKRRTVMPSPTPPSASSLPALRSHCLACGRALSLHERHAEGGYCADWQCRHQRDVARRRQALQARLQAERDAAAAAAGDPAAALAPIVVVRYYDTPLEPVPEAQRQALRDHLLALAPAVDALLAEAAEPGDDADASASNGPARADAAEVNALLGQVCARCTGHCCRLGHARHAFLDAEALAHQRRLDPALGHEALLDRYLAALPALHHAGSCAFHGEHGCVLPRPQRAPICNTFECPGLEQTRRAAEQDGVRRVYVVRHGEAGGPVGGFAPPYPAAQGVQ